MTTIELCPALTDKLISLQLSALPDIPAPQSNFPSAVQEDELLQKISPLFSVEKTVYGGRGCFAKAYIPKNTTVLSVKVPVGSSVARPFRKEVCTWCFHYDDGRTMKSRLLDKIYFCSDSCRSEFTAHDDDGTLTATICAAEDLYVKCAGDISEDEFPTDESELLQVVDEKWDSVKDWETRVFRMKPSKRPHHYPKVTTDDYAEIRYVLSTLHNIARCDAQEKTLKLANLSSSDIPFLEDMSRDEAMRFEIEAFNILQSSEMDKVKRYPYLMMSYINIYKFVRLVSPASWLPFVTPQNIRDIIGRNLTNAFGTWSPTTQEGEEREYFGFGVYPSASFFNHSCGNNVKKLRTGSGYEFVASTDVLPGDELCISYGINGDETVTQRQDSLREWFFVCGCKKCTHELGQ